MMEGAPRGPEGNEGNEHDAALSHASPAQPDGIRALCGIACCMRNGMPGMQRCSNILPGKAGVK